MGGSSTLPSGFEGQPGVYGTLGTPAPGNTPGGRNFPLSWTDANGHLWLFGGLLFETQSDYFNDLWEFDPASGEWAWMGGSSTVGSNCPVISGQANCGQPGVYGVLGTPAPGNTPGGRYDAENWTDSSGSLWLYGGLGFDFNGNWGALDDLWKFDPSTNEWTWMGGSITVPVNPACDGCISGQVPVPGTLETPAAANTPGGLWSAFSWTDNDGNFWLFGGWGYDPSGNGGVPNDLWEFSPSISEWAWMGGSSVFGSQGGVPGTYGVLGTPAAENIPGSRWQGGAWTDASGNLWLFGGEGFDANATQGILNDLWQFSPSTNNWAWMGGSSTLNCANFLQTYCHEAGIYGTLGEPSAANIPGSRYRGFNWKDAKGTLWLFGGDGFDANANWTYLNDLWAFNPATNQWAWMGGISTMGLGASGAGVYGTLGTPAAGNQPGIRQAGASWTDKSGNLWLWGGSGLDANGTFGYLNDLWEYLPPATIPMPPAAAPVFSPPAGTYASAQSVTISDATAAASIYFTIDGTAPTTASNAYSGPIPVSATRTIQAIAVAPGYSSSPVASATYTIAPDFTLSLNPTAITVQAGQSGYSTITVEGVGGFNSTVSFACSGLPAGAACSFALERVPTNPNISFTTLTVTTTQATAALHSNSRPLLPAAAVAALLCCAGFKRRRLQIVLLLAVSAAGLSMLDGCVVNYNPQPVTSTVTVTGTSGSLTHSATFALTVN